VGKVGLETRKRYTTISRYKRYRVMEFLLLIFGIGIALFLNALIGIWVYQKSTE
jgi:hypothetical protein